MHGPTRRQMLNILRFALAAALAAAALIAFTVSAS
jgi:hypothetical protein